MTALTASRSTVRMGDDAVTDLLPALMKANAVGYKGGIACVDATGYCVPGATATGLKPIGIFTVDVTGSGSNGGVKTTVRRGAFKFANSSAGDAIAQADVMADCYIVDDQTVAKTNGGSTRSVAGKVLAVDTDGVWVQLGV